MRRSTCALLRWLFRAAFIAAVLAALTAGSTGLDPDQKWGPFRQALLAVGLLGLGLPAATRVMRALDILLTRQIQPEDRLHPGRVDLSGTRGERSRQPVIPTPSAAPPTGFPGSRRRGIASGKWWPLTIAARLKGVKAQVLMPVLLVAVWSLDVWFVSVGQITSWPPTTEYYARLADAFLHGRTDIIIPSAPDLSGVKQPYHYSNVGINLPYVVDYAYFEGKYYTYFGPVPAVLIVPVMALSHQDIGDQTITFAAMAATTLFAALILLRLQKSHFPGLPAWLLAVGVIVVGTAHPMLWMLSWAAIYSAAISCGQAFLLGGLLFALPSIAGSETRVWRPTVAGLLWALALASRLSLVGAVATFALASIWGMVRRHRWITRQVVSQAFGILIPLTLVGVFLGAYNFIRFGNVLETGVRYTLNFGDPYYLIEDGRLFNLSYLAPDLLYYLATPVNKTTFFPFIRPVRESPASFLLFLSRLEVPETHSVEGITGLLVAAPFILFAGVLTARLICHSNPRQDWEDKTFRAIGTSVLVAGVLAAAPLFVYYLVNSRFLMDFSPLLFIGAVAGSWILYRESAPYPIQRTIVCTTIILAAVFTFVMSFLLAMTGPATLFDDYNPALWQWLRSLASW